MFFPVFIFLLPGYDHNHHNHSFSIKKIPRFSDPISDRVCHSISEGVDQGSRVPIATQREAAEVQKDAGSQPHATLLQELTRAVQQMHQQMQQSEQTQKVCRARER